MRTVAVLFARADSIYKTLPGCDVWDAERDARLWPGGAPIVGHPPCRAWGTFRAFAKPRPDEKDLARWCVDQIRIEGGVLEHPVASTLWPDKGLPKPCAGKDAWGGYTIKVHQFWWGHPCRKSTHLYICGVEARDLPQMPLRLGDPEFKVGGGPSKFRKAQGWKDKPSMPSGDNEKTPPALAEWLVELARRTTTPREQKP